MSRPPRVLRPAGSGHRAWVSAWRPTGNCRLRADDGRDPAPYRRGVQRPRRIGLDEQAGGAEEEAMAVITIQGLTKRFGQVVAVDDLSS